MNKPNPLDGLTERDRLHVARACELQARKIDDAAAADRKAGLLEAGNAAASHASVVRAFGEVLGERETVEYREDVHRLAIEMGLRALIRNVRNAKGTLVGIGESDMGKKLDPIAEHLEEKLLPKFAEQLELTAPE